MNSGYLICGYKANEGKITNFRNHAVVKREDDAYEMLKQLLVSEEQEVIPVLRQGLTKRLRELALAGDDKKHAEVKLATVDIAAKEAERGRVVAEIADIQARLDALSTLSPQVKELTTKLGELRFENRRLEILIDKMKQSYKDYIDCYCPVFINKVGDGWQVSGGYQTYTVDAGFLADNPPLVDVCANSFHGFQHFCCLRQTLERLD